jgi:Ca2+-binding EF-hand superfamily protein
MNKVKDDEGRTMVDFDEFLIMILDKQRELRLMKTDFVTLLFNAGDLNGDGHLQYDEVALLARHLSSIPMEKVHALFTRYCDLAEHENAEDTQKAISFRKFEDLCISGEIFTVERL